ncbi:MAG: hypothetical protein EYC70_12990 [Planctomycetota bacterium]|nr:MAG: hypothetical protein EYC70_12990 [Planctomycetota bacterium]
MSTTLGRRSFLGLAGVGLAGSALGAGIWRSRQDGPIRLGSGRHTYEWVPNWAQLPEGMSFGNTHGCIVTDAGNRLLVNTDTENAVMLFDSGGKLLKTWGKDYAGGAHGMAVVAEGQQEFLYLAHIGRHELIKATPDGEVIWTLGYPRESGLYENADRYHPTSVAVAPNGDIFVADGYGLGWVHQFDAGRKYRRSFGGPGTEPGKMRTPHGLWLDTRGKEPLLAVADRENHRLQFFDLDGKLHGLLDHDLRRPCHVHQRGGDVVVADLAGRVSIFDEKNQLVTHLGDNPDEGKRAQNGVPREQWKDGEFISPHCAHWDRGGDLYVMDWLAQGRVSKLRRVA